MQLNSVTPLILTLNEGPNIRGVLSRLTWANQVIMVDSFSDDATIEIAENFPNVSVIQRPFDSHSAQWNFGLTHVTTDWVLAIDADYICTEDFIDCIRQAPEDVDAYLAEFIYCVYGRPLRATLYPPRAVLFRPARCHYTQDGHTQLLVHHPTRTGKLAAKIIHDDRKSLAHWLVSQSKYAELEADKLLDTPRNELGWKDRLRTWLVFAPVLTLAYCLFVKRLILDGWPGVYYTLQRVYAEILLSLALLDRKLRQTPATGDASSRRELLPEPVAAPTEG